MVHSPTRKSSHFLPPMFHITVSGDTTYPETLEVTLLSPNVSLSHTYLINL